MKPVKKQIVNSLSFLVILVSHVISTAYAEEGNASPPLMILDADLNHFADDHEALVMMARLHQLNKVKLLGVTLVTGNHWMEQLEGDALKAVERMNLEDTIPVFRGADRPLMHNQALFEQEKKLYGSIYAGAFMQDRNKVTPPPDGPANSLKIEEEHAIDFIIRSVRANPGEVTIVAIGPLTNLALAFRKAPDIVPQIKKILYMGGAVHNQGNVTASAEFNWWFDAEAASIVLGEPVEHIIVPLDATDKILFTKSHYDKWTTGPHKDHFIITSVFKPKFESLFLENPDFAIPVWDTLVPAMIYDPEVVSKSAKYWVGVDPSRGANYGDTIAFPLISREHLNQPYGTREALVILEMNEERFWSIYEELVFGIPSN